MKSVKVGVLGATGAVGQRFLSLLDRHPFFRTSALVASERSAGKTYGEATNWVLEEPMPESLRTQEVVSDTFDLDCDVLFSAVPSKTAEKLERDFAKRGYKVFTNASDNRMKEDVPLVITEINPDHLALVETQASYKEGGFVVANGNCTGIVMTLSLKPLLDAFGIKSVQATSMQAVSGAGYPGVASLDIFDNVIPFIGGEEEKMESEPLKQLGSLKAGKVQFANFPISATCTRVPVTEGHTISVFAKLGKDAAPGDVVRVVNDFTAEAQKLKLPTAPEHPTVAFTEDRRPQPKKDRWLGKGMTVSVGRIRKDGTNGIKYVCHGSNTVRGAAGQSLENAEYMTVKEMLG